MPILFRIFAESGGFDEDGVAVATRRIISGHLSGEYVAQIVVYQE